MELVIGDGQQTRGDERAFGFGLIDGQGFPGIGNPVMLHGEDGRSGIDPQDLDANCALQIASGDAERCEMAIDLAEAADVGQNRAANI